ncbi:peptide chain release factor N(5)-glutamine methyltransferase [Myroides odoratus]|uniref:peptide chain release factor N(5)-glutamine methyltransferase n=1 Tax=Myroides odoratus TaxID=256 RepID=UPI00076587E6|nr:peptide chain release factor N(5)-glutamine methyltransferase [Myroides odoratus]
MLIKLLQDQFITALTPIYDELEAQQLFLFCLAELEEKTRIDLVMHPDLVTLNPEKWALILEELRNQKPIQHIFGKAYFYGYTFQVNEYTLIPRPETEELVEWILASVPADQPIRILDIGTGSGCIGLTLAKELPQSQVTLLDISAEALQVAQQNATNLGVDVHFIQQDILALPRLSTTFDVIVSNPPYIRQLEKVEIKKNVMDYEPHTALFVADQDPLIFYRKIAELAFDNLELGGQLFYEINQYLGQEMVELLTSIGFKNTELRRDLLQNDRMTKSVV